MLAKIRKAAASEKHAHHIKFFQQSGWIMTATIAGGALMWAVHFLSRAIPESEYGTLITLFSVVSLIPTMPLQMVITHQTARALATNRHGQLARMIRTVWLATFLFWLIASAVTFLFQKQIVSDWHFSNPMSLWILLLVILLSLWTPMFSGMMQGGQNFLWLGWSSILSAAGRLVSAVIIVFFLSGWAAGIMTGVFIGVTAGCVVGIWQTRSLWRGKSEPFNWHELLRQVVPLMLGFAATQFLFSADTTFVNAYFGAERTAPYGAAGTLSRALLWLVLPLASVMFPKIVHSTAKSEKTNLLGIVLVGTAILTIVGVLGLWLLGPLALKIIYPANYAEEALAVLPWYASAMIPLALANVLVNDLLARGKFQIVPFLVLLAMVYGLALTRFHASLIMVLQTLGVFNLLLFAVCAWFTWGKKSTPRN